MKVIDINNWHRYSQYKNFIAYSNPIFSINTKVDVTDLVNYCKKNQKSFFAVFLYLVSKTANEIEEFRIRIDSKGSVVVYDVVHPSYVVIRDNESIVTCLTEYMENFDDFYSRILADISSSKSEERRFNSEIRADALYISCLRWVDFEGITNPYNLDDKMQSSIPRIVWGKYNEENGRFRMGLNISMHHGLADGFHAARFIINLQNYLNDFKGGRYER